RDATVTGVQTCALPISTWITSQKRIAPWTSAARSKLSYGWTRRRRANDGVDQRPARQGRQNGRSADRVSPAGRHAGKTGDRVDRPSRRRPVPPIRQRAQG